MLKGLGFSVDVLLETERPVVLRTKALFPPLDVASWPRSDRGEFLRKSDALPDVRDPVK
jgi:hypothetical protein